LAFLDKKPTEKLQKPQKADYLISIFLTLLPTNHPKSNQTKTNMTIAHLAHRQKAT
jgi:hypothetical protein